MARKLKPYKVDQVHNEKTRITVEIMLDRETNTFFAMIGATKIEKDTAKECRDAVWVMLRDYTGLEWSSYIIIEHDYWDGRASVGLHEQTRGEVTLAFHRLHGAKISDKRWTSVPFEEDLPSKTYHFGQDHYMHGWDRSDDECVIPYSEEAWATLNLMIAKINELSNWLGKFTKRDDLIKLLSNPIGIPLLEDGKEKVKA